MKICVLNPFFYPYLGGTEKVLLELYKRLAKRHEVCVLSAALQSGNSHDSEEEIEGIRVIRLRSSYINTPIFPIPMPIMHGIEDAIRKEDADIYHINNRYLYYPKTLNAIGSTGGKLVITLHNALPRRINPFIDIGGLAYDVVWGRRIMERADAIVGITKNVVDTTVPPPLMNKASVIFNGIDYKRFRPRDKGEGKIRKIEEEIGEGEIVLNVARLTWQKGQAYLLRAFSEALKERRDLKLLIIGKGHLHSFLHDEAERLGITNKFKMLSDVREEMLPYYYNAAKVFVLPSLYEPASIALLEALASETPVVASKVGGIPEMMRSTGRYVAPRDSTGIAESIIDALEDRKRSERLAKEGRRLMEKEHDWDKIANKYETLFRKIA